jgi:hypothetical protein
MSQMKMKNHFDLINHLSQMYLMKLMNQRMLKMHLSHFYLMCQMFLMNLS